ncbi:MAG TPA: ABC transporter ATP-binding protein [Candidatus Xenobia bacterium]|jgi:putative ABC transport system ATP-binding protein
MPFIELRRVRKVYDTGTTAVTALDHLDLDIEQGAFVALMGPSGCGKTTLLNLLGGMDRPTEGTIQVGDYILHRSSDRDVTRWRRSQVGVVFQAFNLLPTMTVEENVEFPLLLDRVPDRKQKVHAVLDRVGMSHRLTHRPYELSGGEMQRVAVARALVHEPALVLADEPTGNLDSQHGQEVLDLLSAVCRNEGRTVVMATHSSEAATRAVRVIALRDGRVQQ